MVVLVVGMGVVVVVVGAVVVSENISFVNKHLFRFINSIDTFFRSIFRRTFP